VSHAASGPAAGEARSGSRRRGGAVLAALKRPAARKRFWRALNIQVDSFRIWYKITYRRGRVLATEGDAWEAFGDADLLARPERFYRAGAPPRVETIPAGRLAGAEVLRFRFPTLHPLRFAESNLAAGRFYRQARRPDAPVVLISHGWAHRGLRVVEHLYVRPFLRAGFSVAFVAHPMHLERTPSDAYSGELLVSGDVVLTVEGFRQGVVDLIAAAEWLRDGGRRKVGLFGYSLGGYLAGIMAAVREDWAFVVLGGAGDSLVSPILDTPLGRNVREDLGACGMADRARLLRAWAIVSPGALRPRVPRDRILLVAGRYDRIMLPVSVRRLWRAWDRPRLVWLNRGHYTLLATNGGLMARALPFIRACLDAAPARGR
jgi:hypothetical protein